MKAIALFLAAGALALPLSAAPTRQIIGGMQDHSAVLTGDCEHFYNTTFTNFPAEARQTEQRELMLTGDKQLRVTNSGDGGISILGWNKPHARLIVCRTAVAQTKSAALRVLDSITVTDRDGVIAAQGPPIDTKQAWWTNMILYVPRRATIDARAANGGIALRQLGGTVTAFSTSGGVSVASSSGRFKIETESGGITLDRVSGRVDAISRVGAIALKVADAASVPTLEARTAGGGHIICNISDDATWDASRTILRIGDGIPLVRLSTGDAPILIDHIR